MTLASTFRRPRWGMPITISSTAELGRASDDRLERRQRALAAVQAEPLGARELDVQEALEALGDHQLLEDLLLVLGARAEQVVRALHARLDPGLLLRILDVHELDADLGAVGLAQDLDDPTKRRLLEPQHVVEEELALEVGVGEAVGLGVELRVLLVAGETERIEIRQQVAAHPIGADQHDHAQVINRSGAGCARCRGRRSRRRRPPGRRAVRSRRVGAGRALRLRSNRLRVSGPSSSK